MERIRRQVSTGASHARGARRRAQTSSFGMRLKRNGESSPAKRRSPRSGEPRTRACRTRSRTRRSARHGAPDRWADRSSPSPVLGGRRHVDFRRRVAGNGHRQDELPSLAPPRRRDLAARRVDRRRGIRQPGRHRRSESATWRSPALSPGCRRDSGRASRRTFPGTRDSRIGAGPCATTSPSCWWHPARPSTPARVRRLRRNRIREIDVAMLGQDGQQLLRADGPGVQMVAAAR